MRSKNANISWQKLANHNLKRIKKSNKINIGKYKNTSKKTLEKAAKESHETLPHKVKISEVLSLKFDRETSIITSNICS